MWRAIFTQLTAQDFQQRMSQVSVECPGWRAVPPWRRILAEDPCLTEIKRSNPAPFPPSGMEFPPPPKLVYPHKCRTVQADLIVARGQGCRASEIMDRKGRVRSRSALPWRL